VRAARGGLGFDRLALEDPLAQALARRVARAGGRWHARDRFRRPVWWLDGVGIDARLPASLRKDLSRRLRRLHEQGTVEFRLLHGDAADAEAAETHLRLEHHGWKAEAGTSLLSCPRQAAFFREMCARFRTRGALVFAELRLDGVAIASSSNLLIGDTLHAFKTGWAPAYARFSPGRLNEWLLLQALPAAWPGLRCFDSLSGEGGYMDALLPDRATVASGVYSLSRGGNLVMRAARAWRPLAYRFSAQAR
jgi:CelD/BcsL family acetyltransferase involved in cellulose biosynthesis